VPTTTKPATTTTTTTEPAPGITDNGEETTVAVDGSTDQPDIPDDPNPFGLPATVPEPSYTGREEEGDTEISDSEPGETDLPNGPVALPKTGQVAVASGLGLSSLLAAGLALILKKKKGQ
jgi:LPXTG-motif cell wall-anchored protein